MKNSRLHNSTLSQLCTQQTLTCHSQPHCSLASLYSRTRHALILRTSDFTQMTSKNPILQLNQKYWFFFRSFMRLSSPTGTFAILAGSLGTISNIGLQHAIPRIDNFVSQHQSTAHGWGDAKRDICIDGQESWHTMCGNKSVKTFWWKHYFQETIEFVVTKNINYSWLIFHWLHIINEKTIRDWRMCLNKSHVVIIAIGLRTHFSHGKNILE